MGQQDQSQRVRSEIMPAMPLLLHADSAAMHHAPSGTCAQRVKQCINGPVCSKNAAQCMLQRHATCMARPAIADCRLHPLDLAAFLHRMPAGARGGSTTEGWQCCRRELGHNGALAPAWARLRLAGQLSWAARCQGAMVSGCLLVPPVFIILHTTACFLVNIARKAALPFILADSCGRQSAAAPGR